MDVQALLWIDGTSGAGWRHHGRVPDHAVARALECECSDPGCTRFVAVRIAELPQPFDASVSALLSPSQRGWQGPVRDGR